MHILSTVNNMPLWKKIFLAMILGIFTGFISSYFSDYPWYNNYLEYIKFFGDLFIKSLKMIIIPLVFSSVCSAVVAMRGNGNAKWIVMLTFFLIFSTTVLATAIGLGVSKTMSVNQLQYQEQENIISEKPSADNESVDVNNSLKITSILLNLVPSNPFQAFVEGNLIQIIFFACLLGVAINSSGKHGYIISKSLDDLSEVMYVFTGLIMKIAPIGVFALMLWMVSNNDATVLYSLLKYVIVMLISCVLHYFLSYWVIIWLFIKENPLKFAKKILEVQLFAFSTSSSSATLPLTIKTAEEKLGISSSIAKFILPLCATMNMNGSSIYFGVSTVFVSKLFGIDLSISQYVYVIIFSCLSAIGTAGIPGGSLIMMSGVFSSIGLPLEAIGIIAGIDRLIDMMRTSLNVSGDLLITLAIDKKYGKFDKKIYDSSIAHIKKHNKINAL